VRSFAVRWQLRKTDPITARASCYDKRFTILNFKPTNTRTLLDALLHMPLTAQPFADDPTLKSIRTKLDINVPSAERTGSLAIGAALVGFGLTRRSLGGALLALGGAALLGRGFTGHCMLYKKLGINSGKLNTGHGVPGNKGIKVTQSIVINRPPHEVYSYWRKLENLPRFMEHVESVEELDDLHSHWIVKGPAGSTVQWNAAIVTDHDGEMISWESMPGAEVQNAGSVRFEPAGSATNVKVTLQYNPPAGIIGAAVAKFFGEAPDQQLTDDLARFKNILEAQEVAAAEATV